MAKSVYDTLLEQKDRNGRVLLTEVSLQAEPAEYEISNPAGLPGPENCFGAYKNLDQKRPENFQYF